MKATKNYTEDSLEETTLRVAVFQYTDPEDLQSAINTFLDDEDRYIVHEFLQTQSVVTGEDGDPRVVVTVTVVYTEREKRGEVGV